MNKRKKYNMIYQSYETKCNKFLSHKKVTEAKMDGLKNGINGMKDNIEDWKKDMEGWKEFLIKLL